VRELSARERLLLEGSLDLVERCCEAERLLAEADRGLRAAERLLPSGGATDSELLAWRREAKRWREQLVGLEFDSGASSG